MDSSLLQQDRIASIRRRNKTLITVIFSLIIISLALIIGGIIVSFVLKYDSIDTNPAVDCFCSASESKIGCIASLSSSIKTTLHTDPTLVYTLSLEAALQKLSHVDTMTPRSNSDVGKCWSSLRVAMRGLDGALEVIRVHPDMEMRSLEHRRSMVVLIEKAMEALRSCGKDLEKTGSTVHEVEVLLRNSRDFLNNFEWVDSNFQVNDDYWPTRKIVANVATVSLFGSQYLVLIFLFCVFFRNK